MWKRSLPLLLALALLAAPLPAWASDGHRTEKESDRFEKVMPKLPDVFKNDDNDEKKAEEKGSERDQEEEDRHRPKVPMPPLPLPKEPGDFLPPRPSPPHKHPEESPEYDDDFAYYGRVQAVDPEIVVGSRTLVGHLALLDFLAPGMQVEVEGRIVDGRLQVKELHVLEPKRWAYFEGPSPELGWSRVWYLDGRVWKTQTADPGPRVRLLACYRNGWIGLPPSQTPPLTPPEPGLWLLEGLAWHGELRWTQIRKIGTCQD